ncbi:acetyl-CoA carboxylase biotin carboxylase subunit [Acholeplasma equirhinis]|uniref:acetyl-CoA carboxylase biotin carboxylase subunit n=1 Tax=Acholeplasma equirhinis TaxID=555393 RepID=UPI00197AD09A|nr:acetyl-CoA carboxylase biotin carboxylase subunit [Acholeplasma equirhinis]MBN3490187.1 acetyl-CoA carboxylase biotin carboxylase subunit [Acholeplasma equirhinis]
MAQNKILVANRGEIAVRVIRACKELGIPVVAVYSTADATSLHAKLADEAVCIGPASSKSSYLNMQAVLSAAIATGCNAIHPGYGFLSENPKFIEMVEATGIKFIGASSNVVSQLGDKATAKMIAKQNNVPVVEGSDGIIQSVEEGLKVANRIGYPIMIKATAGGGGRGIAIAYNNQEFEKSFELTSLEAETSFGDKSVYIEKFVENPRHIEIQIMGDSKGNVVHLFERDCSMQRRNQKLIEEAPSAILDEDLRLKMGEAAVRLAKGVGYEGAGTIEFLVDKRKNFYFIEMNTRIQVEHPVTEMITGVDLVKEQIKVAYGKELSFKQSDLKIMGHAIECRINAENPLKNFMPTPGHIQRILFPGGFNVRFDSHIYPDYDVPPFYDSMLGKLIVFAPTRKEAIRKMRIALEQLVIEGITTNIEYQYAIMHAPDFIKGTYDTGFVAKFNGLIQGEYNEELVG